MILPPSYKFYGDIPKSKSLKAEALQFYNFIVNQAEKEGLSFINRSKVLGDGSLISIVSSKGSVYSNRVGMINIVTITEKGKPIPQDILVSIQDKESTFWGSGNDYNSRITKRLYTKSNSLQKKDNFYTLGKVSEQIYELSSNPITLPDYYKIDLLSEWRSFNRAMTFHNNVFCIGGKFIFPIISIPGIFTRLYAACYTKINANMGSMYPNLSGYTSAIVGLYCNHTEWKIVLTGIKLSGDSVAVGDSTYVNCTLPIFEPTYTTEPFIGTVIHHPLPCSGFGFDEKTLLLASRTSDTSTTQSVYKIVFNDTYSDNTSTVIYSETPYSETIDINKIVTDLGGGEFTLSDHTDYTLNSGAPIISHLKVDIDGTFCGVRHKITSINTFIHRDFGMGFGPGGAFINTGITSTRDIFESYIDVISFKEDTFSITRTVDGLYRNIVEVGSLNLEDVTTSTASKHNAAKSIDIYYYSAVKNIIIYRTRELVIDYTVDEITLATATIGGAAWIANGSSTRVSTENLCVNSTVLDSDIDSSTNASIFVIITDHEIVIEDLVSSSIKYPMIGTGDAPGNSFIGTPGFDMGRIGEGAILRGFFDNHPAVSVGTSANNLFSLACYSLNTKQGTLLIDFDNLSNYTLLNSRLDLPLTDDPDKFSLRPVGITTLTADIQSL